MSESVTIISGVPQDSVLGPILFLLNVVDIGYIASSRAYIYVGDSKVLGTVKDEAGVECFQADMEEYYEWAKLNKMSFNKAKFVVLRYGKNNILKENTSYFTDSMNIIIEEQEIHKDLCVPKSSSEKFSEHIDNLVK